MRPVRGADGLEQPQRAHGDHVGRVLGHLEAHLDVALGAEVVDLVRLDRVEVADERGGVGQVGVVQEEPASRRRAGRGRGGRCAPC